jgi:2-polyprenyl-6-hydroxyphenyl methylase / 3-demethylubiquinone-9 3-methyltransferase
MTTSDNIDNAEISRFSAMAGTWWDREGEFKALHDINPVRLAYVRDRSELAGKVVLDVGCGGGLLSEALAASGAQVTGIDMADASLAIARAHMLKSGLTVDYQRSTAENLSRQTPEHFDTVTCMELLEHVPRPASILNACARLVKPGGDLFFATVNRTWLSRLLVIGMSEYVLGIVKKGTHEYRKLVKPDELKQWGMAAGLDFINLSGLRYLPFIGYAALCTDTSMNYMMHFKRKN